MFFRRSLPFVFCLLFLALPAAALAQITPSVAVEFTTPQAAVGERVSADVVIRNGANIAGADIGVQTGDCLRIVGKTQGSYLPDASSGGFTVFDQTTDHSARLAVAITDRATIANADGVFFQLDMQVVCDDGSAAVDVTVAELSAYADPTAAQVELVAFTKAAGTLATVGTQVALGTPTGAAVALDPSADTPQTTGATHVETIGATQQDAARAANSAAANEPTGDTQPQPDMAARAIASNATDSAQIAPQNPSTDGSVTQLPPLSDTAQDSAEFNTLILLAAIVVVTAIIAATGAVLVYRVVAARR